MSERERERTEIVRRTSKDHLRQYLESNGAEGGIFRGAPILVLTTTGWKSGEKRSVPLMFGRDGDNYLLVASLGGAQDHPFWYRNLAANPEVEIQDRDVKLRARARTATAEERPRLWALMNEVYPTYAEYQTRTDREIPVVVLEPHD